MISARALAGRLGLRVQIRISHSSRALHLRFADESALWLSPSGSGLAASAEAGSDAHRFAEAHARQVGWETLAHNPNWPVPQPCEPGDWLAIPAHLLPALSVQVLQTAYITRLTGSMLEPESILTLHPPVPMPRLQISRPRRDFLIISRTCIARSPGKLAQQIAQLNMLHMESPDLPWLSVNSKTDALKPIDAIRLLDRLRKKLESMPKEQIDPTPAVSDTEVPAEIGRPDDDPGMCM